MVIAGASLIAASFVLGVEALFAQSIAGKGTRAVK